MKTVVANNATTAGGDNYALLARDAQDSAGTDEGGVSRPAAPVQTAAEDQTAGPKAEATPAQANS